eukprot:snap_masked-scaffold_11-processed-gene-6.22-mRNA-1 protein AED:1.00 eAED:1.00 QI:0/-1/0/0/-1/1/1/0/95
MNDGSKDLESVLEAVCELHFFLSKLHFFETLNSAASGLKDDKRIKRISNLRDVMTGSLGEEKDLDQFIENMLTEFEEKPQQLSLKKLKERKCVGK